MSFVYEMLINVISEAKEKVIILGCTELSLLANSVLSSKIVKSGRKVVLDPLTLSAKRLLKKTMPRALAENSSYTLI